MSELLAGQDPQHPKLRSLQRRVLAGLPTQRTASGIPIASAELLERAIGGLEPLAAKTLAEFASRFWSREGNHYLLRGRSYYLSGPPYVFPGSDRSATRAREALESATELLASAEAEGTLERRETREVVGTVYEHLKSVATHVADVVFRREVIANETVVDAPIGTWLDELYDGYWQFVSGGPLTLEQRDWTGVMAALDASETFTVTMRELDDQEAIARSCLHLLDQASQEGLDLALVCDFVSGGIELGPSLRAFARLAGYDVPKVIHAVYSSKGSARDPRVGRLPGNRQEFAEQLPPRFRGTLDAALAQGGSILLYDNNVTTFKTLAAGKAALRPATTYAAAVHVYGRNIEDSLRGREDAEGLVGNWDRVLDFAPIGEYLTAFSTWGSSAKTRELHESFGRAPATVPDGGDAPAEQVLSLKACRVHGPTDLATLHAAGVRHFGIHAVATDRAAYDEVQWARGARGERPAPHLPVAMGELDSIRAMIAGAPDDCRFTLVIERNLSSPHIEEIARLYGLDVSFAGLQVQAAIGPRDVERLRTMGFRSVLLAVGADDPQLAARLETATCLDPDADALLLDFSVHQPHLISETGGLRSPRSTADLADLVRPYDVPVLVAVEGEVRRSVVLGVEMRAAGLRVAGFDTQNSLEVPKEQWRYRDLDGCHQLVRKSPDLIDRWRRALSHTEWSNP